MNYFGGRLPEPYMQFVTQKTKQMPKKSWPASNLPKDLLKVEFEQGVIIAPQGLHSFGPLQIAANILPQKTSYERLS